MTKKLERLPRTAFLASIALFGVGLARARADTVTVSDVSEMLSPGTNLGDIGTLSIDTTVARALGGEVKAAGEMLVVGQLGRVGATSYTLLPPGATSTVNENFLVLNFPTTLVGYNGGELCSETFLCPGGLCQSSFIAFAGPPPAHFIPLTLDEVKLIPVPEPASIVLLFIGLGCLAIKRLLARQR